MERPLFDIPSSRIPQEAGAAIPRLERSGDRLCMAAGLRTGSLVDTPSGPRAVEVLRPGDLVRTRDNGAVPLLWVSPPCPAALTSVAGARVTPGSRVLVVDARLALLFGRPDCLVMAQDLAQGQVRSRARGTAVSLLFGGPEVVLVDGLWCESLVPDAASLADFGPGTVRDLRNRHPRLSHLAGQAAYLTARPVLNAREAALLG